MKLAGEMGSVCGLPMRQIGRVLERVEMSLRVYKEVSVDASLLFLLAFIRASNNVNLAGNFKLIRANLNPAQFVNAVSLSRQKNFTTPLIIAGIDC